jgi:hypothetical protein
VQTLKTKKAKKAIKQVNENYKNITHLLTVVSLIQHRVKFLERNLKAFHAADQPST